MRVLIVNSVCSSGSTGRLSSEIYAALENEGHEALIAYGRGNASPQINSYKTDTKIEVMLHGLISRFTDRQGFYSRFATRRFIKFIKGYDPDIIQLNNLHGYYLNIKAFLSFLASYGKPVVYTLHDCWQFTGHCAYFDLCGCDKWQSQCCDCPQKTKYPKSILLDNSKLNFTEKRELISGIKNITFVSPSIWLKTLCEKSFLTDKPCEIIYNGVNLDIFKPTVMENIGIDAEFGVKTVISVANIWEERKGLSDIIKLKEVLGEAYRFVLVGVDKKTSKKVPSDIVCIERTDNIKQLAALYSAADVFVGASYEDNLPTTYIEALACGTPVACFDTGGAAEIADQTCGAVVKKGDVASLAAAVTMLCSYERNEMRDNCVKRAEFFELKTMSRNYINLYTELLK